MNVIFTWSALECSTSICNYLSMMAVWHFLQEVSQLGKLSSWYYFSIVKLQDNRCLLLVCGSPSSFLWANMTNTRFLKQIPIWNLTSGLKIQSSLFLLNMNTTHNLFFSKIYTKHGILLSEINLSVLSDWQTLMESLIVNVTMCQTCDWLLNCPGCTPPLNVSQDWLQPLAAGKQVQLMGV